MLRTNEVPILLAHRDFESLLRLLENTRSAHDLEEELNRAFVVDDAELPVDVVTMNSWVRFADAETGAESEVELVYPHRADADQNRISILAPVGTALIGLRVGQSIKWPMPRGVFREFKVVSVRRKNRDE
jgi:regulator of nucleoside diphosphate kinase